MPSPFPGMDPYLEASGLWESFHPWLIPACTESLNRQLPEPYVAQIQRASHWSASMSRPHNGFRMSSSPEETTDHRTDRCLKPPPSRRSRHRRSDSPNMRWRSPSAGSKSFTCPI